MSTTTITKPRTVQAVLDEANPNEMSDALRKAKLGTVLAPLKRAFAAQAAAAAFDLTQIDATGETAGAANPNRLAALIVSTLRVTGGAAAAGPRIITDTGGAAAGPGTGIIGIAKISDDGKTITFDANVTDFVIEYVPRVLDATAMAADFAPTT